MHLRKFFKTQRSIVRCLHTSVSTKAQISSEQQDISSKRFSEGDLVVFRYKDDQDATSRLSKPLHASGVIGTPRGDIKHSSIIGRPTRDLVTSSKGARFLIHQPSLSEYVTLTFRLVTPIYPGDANLIVSLLDLHVQKPLAKDDKHHETLEILEAGTGHGSLTLHLARAIHAANPVRPAPLLTPTQNEDADSIDLYDDVSRARLETEQLEAWKKTRNAVIHSVDVSAKYSKHASRVVQGFRRGMYAGNVDFHAADVSNWIKEESRKRESMSSSISGGSFLSHVLLDMPGAEAHLSNVANVLKPEGVLTVFAPSVTQIASCQEFVKTKGLPLWLEDVVELGHTFTAGRRWNVQAVKPRAFLKREAESELEKASETNVSDTSSTRDPDTCADRDKQTRSESGWTMICRPKVGDRVVGGGFLGVWRRQ